MRRGFVMLFLVLALIASACGGSGSGATPSRAPVGVTGPLDAALLTESQVRQVPSLPTAKVTPLDPRTVFDEADPRAPCGAAVPKLPLTDAAAIAITAENLRGGAQLVVRLPRGAAKQYLDARQANTSKGCPPYETKTDTGQTETVQLVRVVRVHREFDQALAVVLALTVGKTVRAATEIEVRRGDVLARALIYSNTPLPNNAVRGIAAVMGRNLSALDE